MRFAALTAWLVFSFGIPGWCYDRQFYVDRYKLQDDYAKLIGNTGDGFDALYGTRNVREVLKGVLYRGGANNVFNKHGTRPNQNPLPNEGLVNLCQEGFSNAVYLYPENYNTAPHEETCKSIHGRSNWIYYIQRTGLDEVQAHSVLELVYQTINGYSSGPLYVHCWNGWHASGFVSALSLRQFCGFSGKQAVNYWNANTDGNNGTEYNSVRQKIRDFIPDPSLNITSTMQKQLCPSSVQFD